MPNLITPQQILYLSGDDFTLAECEARWPNERTMEAWARARRRYRPKSGERPHRTVEMVRDDVALGLLSLPDDATAEEDLDATIDRLKSHFKDLRRESPTQDFTEFTPLDDKPIALVFTGDWHVGAGGMDLQRLEDDLKLVVATEGAFLVGMGDYVEGVSTANKAKNALISGVENRGDKQEAIARRMAQIAEGKWVAMMAGNHDDWIAALFGISRVRRMFATLNSPVFGQGGGTIFANVGGERYVIAISHRGKKGGQALNSTNAQRQMFDSWPIWENCDVICLGHFHYNDYQRVTRKGRPVVYLRSGTYKTIDPYSAELGLVSESGTPMVILYPNERKIRAFAGDELAEGLAELTRVRAPS